MFSIRDYLDLLRIRFENYEDSNLDEEMREELNILLTQIIERYDILKRNYD